MPNQNQKKRIRNQIQIGLGLNRMLYGMLSIIYIILAYSHFNSAGIDIDSLGNSVVVLAVIMAICGFILSVDGFVALLLVAFPNIVVIQEICKMATKSRTWCFIPISFCYLGFTFAAMKVFDFTLACSAGLPMNLVLAVFGLAFSLHENVITNDKNRYKENVCKRD